MKKIAIMTFPNSPSFGASLQMFALYNTVQKLGYDVEVINYINMYMQRKEHIIAPTKNPITAVRRMVSESLFYPARRSFKKFEKQIKMFPSKAIHNGENLTEIAKRYSHVIVGSDQVWNPRITGGDIKYLLDFCGEKTKRVAYAPSFGVITLDEKYNRTYTEELNAFYALSARETRGQELIKELVGRDSQLVLDPTMLMTKDEWKKQIKKCKHSSKGYIVKFIFNENEKVDAFIRELSEKKGLPVYEIGGHLLTNFLHKDKIYSGPIGPAEWLDVINNAEYIVTDSFHGTAFSIIFEKNLYVSLASKTNSRIVTLLENAGLSQRTIDAVDIEGSEEIDYVAVFQRLFVKKSTSLKYLQKSLE